MDAARDTDFWVLLGIYVLAALVLAYLSPRLLGFIVLAPFGALNTRRRRLGARR